MKRQIHRTAAILIVVASAAGAATVNAHDGATGVVKERMKLMSTLGKSMKTMSAMVRGKVPHDAEKLRQAALSIADHGGPRMTALFPEGSMQAPSEARPEIWQDWKSFSALADEVRARALAVAEAGDDQRKAAFRSLSRTCSGCHKDFRKKKK